MARTVPEWIGKTPDTPVPWRVKDRVFRKFNSICQGGCQQRLLPGRWDTDHIIALINWSGEGHGNRESNLTVLCVGCHKVKTKADVAEKSKVARKRQHYLGPRKRSKMPNSRWGKYKTKLTPTGRKTVLRGGPEDN